MERKNCWEYKGCKEGLSDNVADGQAICPAKKAQSHDGVNGGKMAGRYCWRVAGTHGDDKSKSVGKKLNKCLECEFFKYVQEQETFLFKI
jgi:eukaryotic-like serine/threonine-protein kinase